MILPNQFMILLGLLAVISGLVLTIDYCLESLKAAFNKRLAFIKLSQILFIALPALYWVSHLWLFKAAVDIQPGLQEVGRTLAIGGGAVLGHSFSEWPRWISMLYSVGAGILLGQLCLGYLIARFKLRTATVANIHGHRIWLGEKVAAPMSFGVLNPGIYAGLGFLNLDERAQKIVISHEATHIRSWDHAWKLLSLLNRAILFFSPAQHLLHHRLELLTEIECDRLTRIETGATILEYGSLLVDVSRYPTSAFNLAAGCDGSSIKKRILAMKSQGAARGRWVSLACGLVLISGTWAIAGTLPLGQRSIKTTTKIFVNDQLLATASIVSLEGEEAIIEQIDDKGGRHMVLNLVATASQHKGTKNGVRLNYKVDYRDASGEQMKGKAVMDMETTKGAESMLWIFDRANDPWVELRTTAEWL